MSDYNADVVIVGSGVAGSLLALGLAQSNAKVLIIEAGDNIDRYKAIDNYMATPARNNDTPYSPINKLAPYPPMMNPNDYYIQMGPDQFQSNYVKAVGGTTWHWLGTSLRFVENDFRMKSAYGVGVDWPIGYKDLEKWYYKAEQALPVAGDDKAALGVIRKDAYPTPPIPMTYLDKIVEKAFADISLPDAPEIKLTVASTPQGRLSVDQDGRPACCGSNNCIPMCPVGAKYDASMTVAKAVEAGAQLLTNATTTFVQTDDDGNITGIKFKTPDGEKTATGKIFVIAAHAIETPKLLLMSRSQKYPKGLANSSNQVGRNLMDHNCVLAYGLTKEPVYPYQSPLSTSGVEVVKDGAFRSKRGAFRIEIGNDGWSWPVGYPDVLAGSLMTNAMKRTGGRTHKKNLPLQTKDESPVVPQALYGEKLRSAIKNNVAHEIRFAFLVEQLPDPNNRIEPAFDELDSNGQPKPRLYYKIDDYCKAGIAAAVETQKKMLDALGCTEQHHSSPWGAGHIVGTTRMGDDPKTSVVDKDLRSHDHKNLFILGSNTFPTVAASNPTLTIAALSLRAVSTIQKQLLEMV